MVDYIRPVYIYERTTETGLMSTSRSTSTVESMNESGFDLRYCHCALILFFRHRTENTLELIDVASTNIVTPPRSISIRPIVDESDDSIRI
ncbi:hypothetical protein Bhyg_03172 [Pseudolycoriella hygida]|uniref:Uncharacterized protein n=1 Tax=Pseudolycoriella hygida TaxID=35572 RepID=A0A9Q0S790_9DIPT|nr:hypothetical protein Bhyg_03171 [Pseudolycoriella hygida]KAJ6647947.1 hypothetical protein Bhyg_03172 [Pseudolycoriella hygida]